MLFLESLPLAAALLALTVGGGIEFECPAVLDDDGATLVLVERPDGVWRVGEAVPFVVGQGRFWRLVCAYRAEANTNADAADAELALYWAELPHEEGRPIEAACGDAEDAGNLVSANRQARVRLSAPSSAAQQALARAMLAAAEAVALPCPGAEGAAPVCPRWEIDEKHVWQSPDGRELSNVVRCVWWQRPEDQHRFVYNSECGNGGGWEQHGKVRRVARGRWEREYWTRTPGEHFMVYEGDFSARQVEGRAWVRRSDGSRTNEATFTARCVPEDG